MVPLEHWENIVSAHVNGAPLPAIMDAVRTAAIHWCRDTLMVQEDVTGLEVEAGQVTIDVPNSADGLFPSSVIEVRCPTHRLRPVTRLELENENPTGWARLRTASTEKLDAWFSPRPGRLRLVPHLSVDTPAALDLVVAYQPPRNASEVPTFLYEMFAEEIAAGACAILHSHNQAPYADAAQVAGFAELFGSAVQQHAHLGEGGFHRNRRRTALERP